MNLRGRLLARFEGRVSSAPIYCPCKHLDLFISSTKDKLEGIKHARTRENNKGKTWLGEEDNPSYRDILFHIKETLAVFCPFIFNFYKGGVKTIFLVTL